MKGIAPKYLQDQVSLFVPMSDKPVRVGSGRDRLMFQTNITLQKSSTWIAKMIIEWNRLEFD